jgi:hypothetical protein
MIKDVVSFVIMGIYMGYVADGIYEYGGGRHRRRRGSV